MLSMYCACLLCWDVNIFLGIDMTVYANVGPDAESVLVCVLVDPAPSIGSIVSAFYKLLPHRKGVLYVRKGEQWQALGPLMSLISRSDVFTSWDVEPHEGKAEAKIVIVSLCQLHPSFPS